MAYATTMPDWNVGFAQGMAHWVHNGSALIQGLSDFAEQHTHTGTADGAQVAAGGYAALSIDDADLAANAVTTAKITDANVTAAKLATGAKTFTHMALLTLAADDAATLAVPVFVSPGTVTFSAISLVTPTQIVGADTNYFTLTAYNGGTVGTTATAIGTLTMNAAGGTILAKSIKALTTAGGTLTTGQIVTVSKGTVGSGLQLPAGCQIVVKYTLVS